MPDGSNDYTPPADYRAPDFVRAWSESATRGAERSEQERDQRARDAAHDAEQRAGDSARAAAQLAQDAQRHGEQAARDAQRAAEQRARDAANATSTSRTPAIQGATGSEAVPRPDAAAGLAPAFQPGLSAARPEARATLPRRPVDRGRFAFSPGFAVWAGLAAIVFAFLDLWILVILLVALSLRPILWGFRSGLKKGAVATLATLLVSVAAIIQFAQFATPSVRDEPDALVQQTPELSESPFAAEPVPEYTLEAGAPISGSGEARVGVVLPQGIGELAVLRVEDSIGGLSASMFSGEQLVGFEHVEASTGGSAQWLINTDAAVAQALGNDPTPVAIDSIMVLSDGDWTLEIQSVAALPSFDTAIEGAGPGLYLYAGAGGEATITSGDYGQLAVAIHGANAEFLTTGIPETLPRTWQAGPSVIEVREATKLDGTPLPWSIQVTPQAG